MKKSLSLTETKSMNAKLFFLILFLYQLLFTFQGLDLSDEGFFCTFYQEIFTHPETVQYNFMFWFSGIVGGAFVAVFGDLGVWGLRLFTAIITTGSIILIYNLLKNYLRAGNLQIGLLIATVVMNNNTKVFHYDNLSVFFYIVTAIWLVKGLQNNKPKYLFFAGFIVAMDAFTRIPSIVNTGLVLAIFYYGFSHKVPLKKQFGQAIIFGAGFVTGVAGMLLLMKMTGHLAIFLNAIALVGKMGSGGQESAYGFMKLIQQFINAYFASVKITVLILAAVLAGAVVLNFIAKKGYYRRWMGLVLSIISIAGIIVLIRKGYIDNFTAIYFLTGLSLLAGLLMLLDKTISKDLKLLMFIGCYILLSYPLGSGAGLYSVGIYSLWIAVPIAIDYLSSIQSLPRRFSNWIEGRQFASIRKCTWIACVIVGVYYSWYYPFFDYHERTQMTTAVDGKYFRGIYTTKERAALMSDLLTETNKYVKPGDYLLAYQSVPMINYATHTIPFVHNSMPWFYSADIFRQELDSAVTNIKILPVVVIQKRKTTGLAGGGWPDPAPFYDSVWYRKNIPRDSSLRVFLADKQYRKVWDNEMFMIMVPPDIKKDSIR